MTRPEEPERNEATQQEIGTPDAEAAQAPQPGQVAPPAPESFAANVARLVAEGKLTEAEAAELLEPAHEPEPVHSLQPVQLAKREDGGVPDDLRLDVAGYSLQVVYDPSLGEPRLTANHDGVLSLRAGPGGWSVEALQHHRLGGLKAVLGLPFTPRNVRAEVSGGNLNLTGVSGDAVVEVSGGNATLGHTGRLQAEVSGGNLSAAEVGGDLRLEVSGGNATVERASALRAEVNGGHLSWAGLLRSGSHSLEVNGGQATLRLAAESSVEVRAEATLGGVSASFPLAKSGGLMRASYQGVLGGGEAELRCEVNAGQIRLVGA